MWSRFTNIFKAKASRALDKAENPSETLDYSYNRQLETLQKVKRGVADVVTAKKRLELQTAKLEQTVVKLDSQARQAMAANREDLARTTLERKTGCAAAPRARPADRRPQCPEEQLDQPAAGALPHASRPSAPRKRSSRRSTPAAEAQVRISEASIGPVQPALGHGQQRCSARRTRPSNCRHERLRWTSWSPPARSTTCPRPAPTSSTARSRRSRQATRWTPRWSDFASRIVGNSAGELSSGEPAAEPAASQAPAQPQPEPARDGGEFG